MSISNFYLMPHPPIIVPEVGRGEEKKISKTSDALHSIAKEIAEKAPDTIIIITPHGTMFQDAIVLSDEEHITGSLKKFGAPSISIRQQIHKELTGRICEYAKQEDISVLLASNKLLNEYDASVVLDHGALVPLYFINQYYNSYSLVHITYAPFNDIDLYRFGIIIDKAVTSIAAKAVVIASGDLSHSLSKDGPYAYNPDGDKFDNQFLSYLKNGDIEKVFTMSNKIISNASECGRRSVLILLGTLDKTKFSGRLVSYEGTFGVGYGVMSFIPELEDESKLELLEYLQNEKIKKKQLKSNPYVRLARESLTHYLNTGTELKQLPDYITDDMKTNSGGVFVTLKKNGELRGCIGTISPAKKCIAEEIIYNAIEAGLYDPRFFQVEKEELNDIDFSVDVLTKPEEAPKEMLNPNEYGIIVRKGRKSGLLLPNLEGVDTVEKQLSIALQKADIGANEPYKIERFQVVRHTEE